MLISFIIYVNGKKVHFHRISIHSKKNYSCKILVNDAVYIAIAIMPIVQIYLQVVLAYRENYLGGIPPWETAENIAASPRSA